MRIVDLSPPHVVEHLDAYLAIHADASPGGRAEMLAELPDKWALSFALWRAAPIGYCILSAKFGAPHIHQFMVAPAERGRGIGGVMLAEALRRGAATLKVASANEGAIRFYRRHGWQDRETAGDYRWLHHPCNSRMSMVDAETPPKMRPPLPPLTAKVLPETPP